MMLGKGKPIGGGGGFAVGKGGGGGRSSFSTDFSTLGASSQSRIFGSGGAMSTGVLEEEKSQIEKVFAIVDKDHSGHIDMHELEEMFKLFKEDATLLSNTIQRIMKNVDKDFDGMISASEFYHLLSQKFEKTDTRREIDACFMKMDEKQDQKLDLEEMHKVAQKLGENVSKGELKEMLCMFSKQYQDEKKKNDALPAEKQAPVEEPTYLTMDEFYAVMTMDIPQTTRDSTA